jgi:hypothetical protein
MENVIKPKAVVLPEESFVPDENIISPPPNQFTHRLAESQPYYFHGAQQAMPPNGEFPAGTKVVLMARDGGNNYCRVADGRGLYAEIEFGSLEKL